MWVETRGDNTMAQKCPLRLDGIMTTDEVKQLIEKGIEGAVVTVTDLTGTGDHFKAEIVAPGFEGKTMIQQHKMVYSALEEEMKGPIHALALSTRAP